MPHKPGSPECCPCCENADERYIELIGYYRGCLRCAHVWRAPTHRVQDISFLPERIREDGGDDDA